MSMIWDSLSDSLMITGFVLVTIVLIPIGIRLLPCQVCFPETPDGSNPDPHTWQGR